MAPKTTMTELRKMQAEDLKREVMSKSMTIAKIRMGVEMRQEKDTAQLRREKKDLARVLTVLKEKAPGLSTSQKTSTLPAPKKTSSSKK